jgi:hypothetical protein
MSLAGWRLQDLEPDGQGGAPLPLTTPSRSLFAPT